MQAAFLGKLRLTLVKPVARHGLECPKIHFQGNQAKYFASAMALSHCCTASDTVDTDTSSLSRDASISICGKRDDACAG